MADFKKPKPGATGGGGGSNSPLELIIFGVLVATFFYFVTGLISPLLISPMGILSEVRQYFSPFISENLWWLEIVAVTLSALFLWGTVYIIRQTNYLVIMREQYFEVLGKDHLFKDRSLRAWKKILRRLESDEANEWRLAVLECDHILNEILKMSGYLGSMDEKLPNLTSEQLPNIEDVRRAHIVRDKISYDPSCPITKEEATEVAKIYEQSFRDLNLLRD